jgi:outer membrane immunogenic protein
MGYTVCIVVQKRLGMMMMKNMLLAGTALVTLVSGSAMAADMRPARAPVYTKAPMMAPVSNWTGCYVGGNAGGLWTTNTSSLATGAAQSTQDLSGGVAGGQIGCNYQVSMWVFGIQGDYDWSNASGNAADAAFAGGTDRANVKSLASVTGRAGYAWDRFLGYVKGGGAWVSDNYSVTSAVGLVSSASETRNGWTIGVGGEYAFTDTVSGFAEYDYYDFGTTSDTFTGLPGTVSSNIKQTVSVAKGGVNFKFSAWH